MKKAPRLHDDSMSLHIEAMKISSVNEIKLSSEAG
jgi:hypothetical protein